jgi:hypothetical protein
MEDSCNIGVGAGTMGEQGRELGSQRGIKMPSVKPEGGRRATSQLDNGHGAEGIKTSKDTFPDRSV